MTIATIGLDLAKQVFQLHGVDAQGKTVLRKQLSRQQLAPFFANLPPCLIGMKACGSAHFWARKLESFGHIVKLAAIYGGGAYDTRECHNAIAARGAAAIIPTRKNAQFRKEKAGTRARNAILRLSY